MRQGLENAVKTFGMDRSNPNFTRQIQSAFLDIEESASRMRAIKQYSQQDIGMDMARFSKIAPYAMSQIVGSKVKDLSLRMGNSGNLLDRYAISLAQDKAVQTFLKSENRTITQQQMENALKLMLSIYPNSALNGFGLSAITK